MSGEHAGLTASGHGPRACGWRLSRPAPSHGEVAAVPLTMGGSTARRSEGYQPVVGGGGSKIYLRFESRISTKRRPTSLRPRMVSLWTSQRSAPGAFSTRRGHIAATELLAEPGASSWNWVG